MMRLWIRVTSLIALLFAVPWPAQAIQWGAGTGTSYPAALDTANNRTNVGGGACSSAVTTNICKEWLNDWQGAVIAIMTELGTLPKGGYADVKTRLDAAIYSGGALGTPSSGIATNLTGLPAASVLAGTFGAGAYVMDTTLTLPTLIGGTGTTSTLTLQSTSGVGTTGADIIFKVGNAGGTEAGRFSNAGLLTLPLGLTVSGGVTTLQETTTATTGVILKGTNRWLHNFHHPTGSSAIPDGQNTFLGVGAGNFTMGATATATTQASYNTVVGYGSFAANTLGSHNVAVGRNSLVSNTTGESNTVVGDGALYYNISGSSNVAVGFSALNWLETGSNNIAIGVEALKRNVSGTSNVAIGTGALQYETANNNTAMGHGAMGAATTADSNTAIGSQALDTLTTGNYNMALGSSALQAATTSSSNTAIGYQSMFNTTTGASNSAIGNQSLQANTTGASNTGIGAQSLDGNTTGLRNVGIGQNAGYIQQTGNDNVLIGAYAGDGNQAWSGSQNVALGAYALNDINSVGNNTAIGYKAGYILTTGANNILLGLQAGDALTTGSNNIIIGYDIDAPSATASNQLSVGNLIFATGVDGTGTTISTGGIGIGVATALTAHRLDIEGGHLKVGTAAAQKGVTLYDTVDGSAHCVTIATNALNVAAGACS